jgi:hypothetical protein
MLWLAGSVVALSTSCKVTLKTNTEDSGTKDDGMWPAPDVTGLAWEMSNDSLAAQDDAATVYSFKKLSDAWLAQEPIEITFGTPTNASDSGVPEAGWTAPTASGFTGKAIISNLELTADKDGKAKISISLQGYGELKKVAAES